MTIHEYDIICLLFNLGSNGFMEDAPIVITQPHPFLYMLMFLSMSVYGMKKINSTLNWRIIQQ